MPEPTAPTPASDAAPTREQRLAARLRDNLHRRKAQARALSAATPDVRTEDGPAQTSGTPQETVAALPKTSAKS